MYIARTRVYLPKQSTDLKQILHSYIPGFGRYDNFYGNLKKKKKRLSIFKVSTNIRTTLKTTFK